MAERAGSLLRTRWILGADTGMCWPRSWVVVDKGGRCWIVHLTAIGCAPGGRASGKFVNVADDSRARDRARRSLPIECRTGCSASSSSASGGGAGRPGFLSGGIRSRA